jgi:hypothetical protein
MIATAKRSLGRKPAVRASKIVEAYLSPRLCLRREYAEQREVLRIPTGLIPKKRKRQMQHLLRIGGETEPGLFTEFKIVLPRTSRR